jgi:hypothetical protein
VWYAEADHECGVRLQGISDTDAAVQAWKKRLFGSRCLIGGAFGFHLLLR